MIGSALVFVFFTGQATFIFHQFCFVTAVKSDKSECFTIRELYLNFGRLLSYLLIVLIVLYGDFELLKYILFLLTFGLAAMGGYAVYLNKRLDEEYCATE